MMQRHGTRHFISYLITTLLYVGVAVIFFYSKNHHYVSSEIMEEKTIEMSLSTFVPEVVEPPKKIIKEVVEPEPIVEEIIEEPLPEPVVEKVVETPIVKKPKPVIKKRIEKPKKKKVVKKKVIKKKKVTKKKKPKKKPSSQQASSKQSKSTKAERNKFWTKLRVKIDRNKFYPRIAKKRGMQGSVKVKFTILANGNVGHISVSGPKVFYNSARNAVKKAFPINAKKSPISLPTSINLTLRYQLR